mmetsp:Transcript_12964/g.45579  ORF Transcript_12964/g.45579 Transcript_12964/m.45579 type:complete len:405 (-) Transcript_12964:306-1520(-)
MVVAKEIEGWLEKIPLRKGMKNLARDFSDGCMCAEVIKNFLPTAVDLHNYSESLSVARKRENWIVLNHKVLKKHLGINLGKGDIEDLCSGANDSAEKLLLQIKKKIESKLSKVAQTKKEQQAGAKVNDAKQLHREQGKTDREEKSYAIEERMPEAKAPTQENKNPYQARLDSLESPHAVSDYDQQPSHRKFFEPQNLMSRGQQPVQPSSYQGNDRNGYEQNFAMNKMLLEMANYNLSQFDLRRNAAKPPPEKEVILPDVHVKQQTRQDSDKKMDPGRRPRGIIKGGTPALSKKGSERVPAAPSSSGSKQAASSAGVAPSRSRMVATKRGVGFSREAWPEEESNVDGNGRDVVSECNSILSDVRSVYDQLESSLAALEERVRVTNGGLQGFSGLVACPHCRCWMY